MSAETPPKLNVCLVGLGSIGISFAALHLRHGTGTVTVYDTRPDLQQHIEAVLPAYLGGGGGGDGSDGSGDGGSSRLRELQSQGRLVIAASLAQACAGADVVQEQGPERLDFKRAVWAEIEKLAPPSAHLWSSTSGIAASRQAALMTEGGRSRLMVVHPFNPPHVLPLIELVPSPDTAPAEVAFARAYFAGLGSGHRPVVVRKEVPGFVGNRLAYVLFREAAWLVREGVASAADVDEVVRASLGPRFAVQGPFRAYHMGGGAGPRGGIRAFLDNLGPTIQEVWDSYEPLDMVEEGAGGGAGGGPGPAGWIEGVVGEVERELGEVRVADFEERDERLRAVIATQK